MISPVLAARIVHANERAVVDEKRSIFDASSRARAPGVASVGRVRLDRAVRIWIVRITGLPSSSVFRLAGGVRLTGTNRGLPTSTTVPRTWLLTVSR